MPALDIEKLKFPSGRSVGNCRKDAKRHASATGIPLHQAQDQIARQNGATKPWHHALNDLQTALLVPPGAAKAAAGTMTVADIRAVLEKHWELTHFGMGPNKSNSEGASSYMEALERGQSQLLQALGECNLACAFLRHVDKRKTINPKAGSSYGLKHAVEGYVRRLKAGRPENGYVANGAFICAAIHMGFVYRRLDVSRPNVYFNMSSKSPVFEWSRLLVRGQSYYYDPKAAERLTVLAETIGATTER